MSYTMQYGQIWPYLPTLAAGALLSLQIAFLAFCGGLALGTVGASILSFGGRITKAIVRAYVTFFTNTPQLVQFTSFISRSRMLASCSRPTPLC